MKKIITEILNSKDFISSEENFLSEGDLQFSLAKMFEKKCKKVILEYPIKAEELYKNSENIKGKNAYIDIYCEYKGTKYYIELKHKTKKSEVIRHGIEFRLKDHNAYPDNRYSVYRDIERLEHIVLGKHSDKRVGYVLFLTNVGNYSKQHDELPLTDKLKTYNKNKVVYERKPKLNIQNQYLCKWKPFKNHNGFQYLLIKIENNKEIAK